MNGNVDLSGANIDTGGGWIQDGQFRPLSFLFSLRFFACDIGRVTSAFRFVLELPWAATQAVAERAVS